MSSARRSSGGGRRWYPSIDFAPEAYGLPPDPTLLGERLLKEAVHELGHTLGLTHCQDSTCVMHPATYAEEIDLKSASFCLGCRDAAGLVPRPPARPCRSPASDCRPGLTGGGRSTSERSPLPSVPIGNGSGNEIAQGSDRGAGLADN